MESISNFILDHGAAVSSILVAMLALTRPVRQYIWRVLKKFLWSTRDQLDRIEAELHTNGGTSLRDCLNRIEDKQIRLDGFIRAQLNVHNLPIIRADEEGKIIFVNRTFQKFTGFSYSELMGDAWINAIEPNDRERIRELWDRAVAELREFDEFVCLVGNKRVHWHMFKEESNGGVKGWTGFMENVQGGI
jgi:PAS domain S-box-containing protein